MNHKLTHTLVAIVTAVLVAATLGFSFAVTATRRVGAGTPVARTAVPAVSHPTGGSMADCTRCHVAGREGLRPNHATYTSSTCGTCHRPASATPARASQGTENGQPRMVPHPTARPYDDCTGCHAMGGSLGMPEDHAEFASESCLGCHRAKIEASERP